MLVNNNLQSFITEKKAIIIGGNLPILRGHTSLLVQLFQNFINNGLKYNKKDAPTVTISTEWQGKDLVFKIKDNGIGILPQYQDQIFGMFRRLHSSAEYEGSGIGWHFANASLPLMVDGFGSNRKKAWVRRSFSLCQKPLQKKTPKQINKKRHRRQL